MIQFFNTDANVSTDGFTPNGQWNLLKTSTHSGTLTEGDGSVIPIFGFILSMERVPTYYIFNIVLPVAMLMVLSVVGHILPPESGEKIGLQITILLAFSVMLLIMSDSTPKAGTTTPLLSKSRGSPRSICIMTSSNENVSALLAFCEGNPPVTGGFT